MLGWLPIYEVLMSKIFTLILALSFFPASLFADINYSSICKVVASTSDRTQGGTGFIYNEDKDNYYVMTNGHVVEGMSNTYISFYKDSYVSNLIPTKVVAKQFQPNTTKDIAVLLLDKEKAPFKVTPLKLYDVAQGGALKVGDKVIGAGYPDGYWLQEWQSRLSQRKIQNVPSLTTLTMGPVGGQSGSPVMVEIDGENYVVGMVTFRFGAGIKPTESFGGYINIDYIKSVLNNTSTRIDVMPAKVEYHINPEIRRADSYIQTVSTQQNVQYYVWVNQRNQVVDYYILPNGEKMPKFYTEAEFGQAKLRPGDSFFPAEQHPVCRDGKFKRWLRQFGNKFPTIEMHPPKEPFINKDLPPFNNVQPKDEKLNLWPEGSPFDKKNKPEAKDGDKAANNDVEKAPQKPVEAPKPDPRIAELEAKLKHAQDEQKRLKDDTLSAQRKVWEKKEAELLAQIEAEKKRQAEKPAPSKPKSPGLFARLFNKVSDISSNAIGGIAGMLGFSQEGVILSLIGLVGPLLIPGVRQFAIAKGISPALIKGAEYAVRFGKYLVSKKNDKVASKPSVMDDDVLWAPFEPDDIPVEEDSVPVPVTTVVVEENSEKNEEKEQNSSESQPEENYNQTEFNKTVEELQDSKVTVPQSIKDYIDLRVTHGEKLQEMVLIGHLYEEAVTRLGKGELTDTNGGPLVSHKSIHNAISRWVRDEYIKKIPYQTSLSADATSYLTAYRGWLYQQAVQLLENGEFNVLNHATAARVIQEWVQNEYYKKITRHI